jgi:sugar phosphate isomerase/epimerase
LVEAVPLLANQGVTAIEVDLNDQDYFDWKEVSEVQSLVVALADSGVRAHSVHSPHSTSLDVSSLNDSVHEQGVDALIESIELASVLGAGMVIVHASERLDGAPNGRFERARGVLREMSVVARETGIVLALENLPPGRLGHTPEELLDLMDGCDRGGIGVCFDAGHANLSGRFAEFTRALLPRSIVTEVHDNDGGKDQHMFPGQGTIHWNIFTDTYRNSACNASITLQCPPPHDMPWKEAFQELRAALGD